MSKKLKYNLNTNQIICIKKMNSEQTQQLKQTQPQVTIISIEGNIGSGKSTILSNLKKHFQANTYFIFVDEPVNIWESIKDEHGENMIQKFYSDQNKYSFAFQIMAYTSRLSLIKSVIDNNQHLEKLVIITERSLETDRYVFAEMLYKQHHMESVLYQIYLQLFNEFSEKYNPSIIIYINVMPDVCYNRVNKRSRSGEIISWDYLNECGKQHDYFVYEQNANTLKLVLDANTDVSDAPNIMDEWISYIAEFINKNI